MSGELNTVGFSDFVKLAKVKWAESYESVSSAMLESGMVKKQTIPQMTGNTREFSQIDDNEYLTRKGQGDQAVRAQVQQGLVIALIKSSLINGENLKTAIKRFKVTLRKAISHLQRLSERNENNSFHKR